MRSENEPMDTKRMGRNKRPLTRAIATTPATEPPDFNNSTMVVCSTCRILSLHKLQELESLALHAGNIMLDDLISGESSNCATCSMLYRGILGVVREAISRYQHISIPAHRTSLRKPTISSKKGPLRLDLWPRDNGTRKLKLQYNTHFGMHS